MTITRFGGRGGGAASTRERVPPVWHPEEGRWRSDGAALAARFAALVGRLGGRTDRAAAIWRPLYVAWGSPSRRYHNREHLIDCLGELDRACAASDLADVAELALTYHDAVYEPRGRDCEARSAALLCEDAGSLEIPRDRAARAAACVRATAHGAGAAVTGPAEELVVDIDLAILGRDPVRFLEYEHAIAEEYAHVPWVAYTLARGRFLEGLLRSPAIFRTPAFRDRYEEMARANIAALLSSARYRAHRWLSALARRCSRTAERER
jgi:predicted metal-dependent HD superfamily phosphohydrolase